MALIDDLADVILNSLQGNELPISQTIPETDWMFFFNTSNDRVERVLKSNFLYAGNINVITIESLSFQLFKNPDNDTPANMQVMEINDIIKGFTSGTNYIEAVYLGGDTSLFDDLTVYNVFAGTLV
jgi:hypothetical protein